MNHIQLDADKAKEWLAKGVQPSDTMHNLLISQKVIEGKKINVLPKKSPIVDEEANKKAEEEAAEKTEAEETPAEDAAEEEKADEAPAEETTDEAPAAEETAETPDETEEAPAEEAEKAAA